MSAPPKSSFFSFIVSVSKKGGKCVLGRGVGMEKGAPCITFPNHITLILVPFFFSLFWSQSFMLKIFLKCQTIFEWLVLKIQFCVSRWHLLTSRPYHRVIEQSFFIAASIYQYLSFPRCCSVSSLAFLASPSCGCKLVPGDPKMGGKEAKVPECCRLSLSSLSLIFSFTFIHFFSCIWSSFVVQFCFAWFCSCG